VRPLIYGWCVVAAAFLIVTATVHVSTFLPIDPMDEWPGVMFLHVAMFLPFGAALWYASRAGGEKKSLDPIVHSAPRWMQGLTVGLFAYAIFNFGMFLTLSEGGGPTVRDGKYLLTSHGRVIRELTEAEYHRQRAYEVRGFSGHWMVFASASLMLLVGATRGGPGAEWEPDAEPPAVPVDSGSFYLED
jgi:hypothetical protein